MRNDKVAFRVPRKIKMLLEIEAEEQGCSISDIINDLLEQYFFPPETTNNNVVPKKRKNKKLNDKEERWKEAKEILNKFGGY